MDKSIKVDFDPKKLIAKFKTRQKAAQVFLDEAVLNDTEKYVRFRSGALARSARTASKIGQGQIIYDTAYAKRVYYDEHSYVTRDTHPYATSLWFEASKKANLQSWQKGVEKILTGGNRS